MSEEHRSAGAFDGCPRNWDRVTPCQRKLARLGANQNDDPKQQLGNPVLEMVISPETRGQKNWIQNCTVAKGIVVQQGPVLSVDPTQEIREIVV